MNHVKWPVYMRKNLEPAKSFEPWPTALPAAMNKYVHQMHKAPS